MTQEETKKVWIDLSARVIYHSKIRVTNTFLNQTYDEVLTMANFTQFADIRYEIKPYLRSLSSMREEEAIYYDTIYTTLKFYEKEDWLNSHYFDYRGLIPMGLALEAREGMYDKTTCDDCLDKDYCSQSEYIVSHCCKLKDN